VFATRDIPIGEWMSDRQGRMYLSRYFETFNVSVEKWFESTLDLPFHQLHVDRRVGIPTVRFETKCRELPRVGDNVSVLFRPIRIGSRSMTSRSWMVRDGECLVETEQVIVFVQMQENGYETIEIPEYVRDAFATQLKA
jgi:4-hydroxybenzoyl-CoA thioesterase